MSELDKLAGMLLKYDIPFKARRIHDGYQITVDSIKDFSAICHSGSYGGPEGYIEIMGLTTNGEKELGGVAGWLSADNVLVRILRALGIPYKSNENTLDAIWKVAYGSQLEDGSLEINVICSNCEEPGSFKDNYCSQCGAKMNKY